MDEAEGKGWQEPVESDLKETAQETWRILDHAPLDGTNMVYRCRTCSKARRSA